MPKDKKREPLPDLHVLEGEPAEIKVKAKGTAYGKAKKVTFLLKSEGEDIDAGQ